MLRIVLLLVLLVAVVAGAAITYAFKLDISAAEARVAGFDSAVVETSFGKIAYAEKGAGPPLLAIHGSGGGFDQGLDFTQSLADEFRLIAPSRFGYVGSDLPENATIEMQADALDEFMARVGLDRAFIFGGSAGTLSAMELAIRHPERCRALVLAVPAAYAPTRKPYTAGNEGPFWFGVMRTVLGSDFFFWSLMKASPDTMTRLLLATEPDLVAAAEPAERARVRGILTNILPVSPRAAGLLIDMATAGNPPQMALERITCPVLTLSMKDDLFGTSDPAEFIAATVPDGRAIIYPSGGHVWVGREEDIWREIRAFLKATPEAADAPASPLAADVN